MNPDSKAGEFHGHLVLVDTIDAAAGDLAAQQGTRFDLHTIGQITQGIDGSITQPVQFTGHFANRVESEPIRQASLNAVYCGHQKVSRTHGDIGAAEIKECFS